MSKITKILTLTIVLFLTLTLASCKNKDIKEQLEEAKTALLLTADRITDDIDLPSESLHKSKVTWKSSNTDVINIVTEEGKITGKVARPEYGSTDDGYVIVTLTATIKIDDESVISKFRLRVEELPEKIGITAAGVLAQNKGTQIALDDVIVFGIIGDGYYVYDETGYMFVFTSSAPSENVKIGDKIRLYGEYDIYYNQPEVVDPVYYRIVDSDNDLPTPVAKTIAEIVNFDTGNKSIYANYYTIEGIVSLKGEYKNVFIEDIAGNEVDINYKSNADAFTELEGEKVRINVVLHTFRTDTQAWRVSFLGTEDDIEVLTFTDQDRIEHAKNIIEIPEMTDIDISLPTKVGTTTVTWESSHPEIIAIDGKVTLPDEITDVTITATFKYGTTEEKVNYVIKVLDEKIEPLTVKQAIVLADKTETRVKAIVVAKSGNGYVVYSGGEFGFIYISDEIDTTVGDEIIFNTTIGSYKNLVQLQEPVILQTVSSDNDLPNYPDGKLSDLEARTITGATIIAKVTVGGTYENVFLSDVHGGKIEVYYKSTPEYQENEGAVLKAYKDKTIRIPVVMYQDGSVLFLGTADDIEEVTLTDEQLVGYAKDGVSLPYIITSDISLPTEINGVQISWESDKINIDATNGKITRPAVGESDATVTLTGTFTLNDATITENFVVTVKALSEPTLIISEYIEGSSNNKAIEIYNGTGAEIDLTEYSLVLYSNGSETASLTLALTGTLAHGEVLVIAHGSAVDAIKDKSDVINSSINHNGDDAYELKKGDIVIDTLGVVGVSTEWGKDVTLVRKSMITSGTDTFDETEWIVHPSDTFDYLGSHSTE